MKGKKCYVFEDVLIFHRFTMNINFSYIAVYKLKYISEEPFEWFALV
jgi:hypothetical protein